MRVIRTIGLLFLACFILALPSASLAQIGIGVGISVRVAPPPLPVYEQPICPGDGFIWTPGYWGFADGDYYWVPGTWVRAPFVGGLWTPGYWGWGGGLYLWHSGYWGRHIGFYGGVNYGFGYGGVGFVGGYWRGGVFAYNRSVTNVNVTVIHNTYNQSVSNTNVSRTSFNGGSGGTTAQPNAAERAAANEHHTPATSEQMQHERTASTNKSQFASVNHGSPSIAATPRSGAFNGSGTVGAKGSGAVGNGGDRRANSTGGNMRNNPQPVKNTNAPKGNSGGSGKPNAQGTKSSGARPAKNPPPPKGKGGTGGRDPKQHQ